MGQDITSIQAEEAGRMPAARCRCGAALGKRQPPLVECHDSRDKDGARHDTFTGLGGQAAEALTLARGA